MNKLKIAVDMARGCWYNAEAKEAYKRFSLNLLRSIARNLKLPRGSYRVSFNPGGIAVAGDPILHHDSFYLTFCSSGVMYRKCDGLKDYGGKWGHEWRNQWAVGYGNAMTQAELEVALREIVAPGAWNKSISR